MQYPTMKSEFTVLRSWPAIAEGQLGALNLAQIDSKSPPGHLRLSNLLTTHIQGLLHAGDVGVGQVRSIEVWDGPKGVSRDCERSTSSVIVCLTVRKVHEGGEGQYGPADRMLS